MVRQLLSVRWVLTTLLVIAAVAVMARLGFWQIDRLEQRRAFNARVSAQLEAPPLDLNEMLDPARLDEMEYRAVSVSGTYDFSQQVALRNQVSQGVPGLHLITPLRITGSDAVILVDRGWIPLEDADPAAWQKYDQPGAVTVQGVLRNSMPKRGLAGRADPTLAPGQGRLPVWNFLDLGRIATQLDRPALPVFIQQLPSADPQAVPRPEALDLDLSEGSHAGYALQWFTFAAILAVGYPFFVARQLKPRSSIENLIQVEKVGEKE